MTELTNGLGFLAAALLAWRAIFYSIETPHLELWRLLPLLAITVFWTTLALAPLAFWGIIG